jgi:hypothetical protein
MGADPKPLDDGGRRLCLADVNDFMTKAQAKLEMPFTGQNGDTAEPIEALRLLKIIERTIREHPAEFDLPRPAIHDLTVRQLQDAAKWSALQVLDKLRLFQSCVDKVRSKNGGQLS